ncbi:MAG: serine/threonine-protein kinase, partial [Planctomycetota bacterium]
MNAENPNDSISDEARALYEQYRHSMDSENPMELEVYARQRPDLAEELHRLDRAFQRADGILANLDTPQDEVSAKSSAEFLNKIIRNLSSPRDSNEYHVRGLVARGGMSEIYEVRDERLRRNLAMKIFPVNCRNTLTKGERRRVGRFLEEAQVAAQLKHPAILHVYDLGIDHQGRPFITMPLVKGREFSAIIDRIHNRDEEWTLTRGLNVVHRICEAMAYAHSKGVTHRDLKPGNIMVGEFGETYVMDWGLAKVANSDAAHEVTGKEELDTLRKLLATETPLSPLMTIDGQVVGTPAYMAPEQAMGRINEVGDRSDIYSLGAVLYQLLTGQRPYAHIESDESPYRIISEIVKKPPKQVTFYNPKIPEELVAICEKAMARYPVERYESMRHFGQDLRAHLEGHVVQAHRTGALVELGKWMKRHLVFVSMLGLLMLVLIGSSISLGILYHNSERERLSSNRRLKMMMQNVSGHKLLLTGVPSLKSFVDDFEDGRLDPRYRIWTHPELIEEKNGALILTRQGPSGSEAFIGLDPS